MESVLYGMHGLGDGIMQRPFVKALRSRRTRLWVATPWPELYSDLDVQFVRTNSRLRTQRKNEDRSTVKWTVPSRIASAVRLAYGAGKLERMNIWEALEQDVPLEKGHPIVLDLPRMGDPWPIDTGGKPLALVRPVTERMEWLNQARSPKYEYVNQIARMLMDTHHVVAVADTEHRREWVVGAKTPAHESFLAGEIPVPRLLELARTADVLVGGVGWIVPAAVALQVKCFCILGGCGGHNAPEKLLDPRMDRRWVRFAWPDTLCMCTQMEHTCSKRIADLEGQWRQAQQSWTDRLVGVV